MIDLGFLDREFRTMLEEAKDEEDVEDRFEDFIADKMQDVEAAIRQRLSIEQRNFFDEDCSTCCGSTECVYCGGTGEDKEDDDEKCFDCQGSGECQDCNGSGLEHPSHH